MKTRRMTLFSAIVAVLVGLLALLLIVLVMTVDDWSRDLTTNHAETSPAAADPQLRPIVAEQSPADLADLVESVAEQLPNWSLQERQAGETIVLKLVRTTPMFRFRDDITVRIAPGETGTGALLSAESQSRVGRGDLGQNPRNLKALLDPLRERLKREQTP